MQIRRIPNASLLLNSALDKNIQDCWLINMIHAFLQSFLVSEEPTNYQAFPLDCLWRLQIS